ncbi:MAG: hypothetical protein ACLGHN_15730 [Bacteriovoracia bacterium]
MEKSKLSLALSALILLPSSAHALELIVVNNYDAAETQEIWKKAKTDQVPDILLSKESLEAPHSAYASVFPKTFFQESLFAVCHKSCEQKDIFDVNQSEINSKDLRKWDVVEQSNVYFWLKKYFNFLENKLSYRPEKFLRVTTNRELKDETRGKS